MRRKKTRRNLYRKTEREKERKGRGGRGGDKISYRTVIFEIKIRIGSTFSFVVRFAASKRLRG